MEYIEIKGIDTGKILGVYQIKKEIKNNDLLLNVFVDRVNGNFRIVINRITTIDRIAKIGGIPKKTNEFTPEAKFYIFNNLFKSKIEFKIEERV